MSSMRGLALLTFQAFWVVLLHTGGCLAPDAAEDENLLEFCQNEAFDATCNNGDEVVLIEKALYGRMRIGNCVASDFGFIGCYKDVLTIVNRRCSGRRRCVIDIPDTELDAAQACNSDLKNYLGVRYECVKVDTEDFATCQSSDFVDVKSSSGLLSSQVTKETSCGGHNTPWRIRGDTGQRINLTLLDFSLEWDMNEGGGTGPNDCIKYATVQDGDSSRLFDICGKRSAKKVVYTSHTNEIKIRINTLSKFYFLIQYEVIGCGDLKEPENMWSERDGNKVTVGCPSTGERWHLVCRNNAWYGPVGNCSQVPSDEKPSMLFGDMSLPLGASILIIILIALAIGGVILILGIMGLKRRSVWSKMARERRLHFSDIPIDEASKEGLTADVMTCHQKHPAPSRSSSTGMCRGDVIIRRACGETHLGPSDGDYSYVWDMPEGQAVTFELAKDPQMLRYDTAYPRTFACLNKDAAPVARCHGHKYNSLRMTERAPLSICSANPDVAAHGAKQADVIPISTVRRYPKDASQTKPRDHKPHCEPVKPPVVPDTVPESPTV